MSVDITGPDIPGIAGTEDDDEIEEITHLAILRGYYGEFLVERQGEFWIQTLVGDFGPYDTLKEALFEPVDGPITAMTAEVMEVRSDRISTAELLEHLYIFNPEETPYAFQVNGEWFEARGEQIILKESAEDDSTR